MDTQTLNELEERYSLDSYPYPFTTNPTNQYGDYGRSAQAAQVIRRLGDNVPAPAAKRAETILDDTAKFGKNMGGLILIGVLLFLLRGRLF
jgi:hypothetical protein